MFNCVCDGWLCQLDTASNHLEESLSEGSSVTLGYHVGMSVEDSLS